MKVIDQILLEWAYRCPDGIVDINNPKKKAILDEILKEFNVSLGEVEGTEDKKLKSSEIGSVITSVYGENIPKPTQQVELGKDFNLSGEDAKVFAELFEKTPTKAGSTTQTKGSGNGEVSVYWLYSQNGFNVVDERGSDKPDLKINNIGVEVKAYDVATITLGKFAKDKESLKLLNIVFGFRSLVSSIKNNDKEANPANFNSQDLINAFDQMFSFSKNDTLRKIAEENGFDIITEIYNKIDVVKKSLNLGSDDSKKAAATILRQLAVNKLSRKPGIPGYVLDVTKNGNGKFFSITQESLDKASDETILNSIKINQAQIDMNFKNIFG
jgi:hypothetical protein